MTQDWQEFEQETLRIQARFERELEGLRAQGLVTQTDIHKVQNQVLVTRKALLETVHRRDLQSEIKEELFASLIRDYINSIQRIIDDALFKLGADVFLKYKFGQVDAKAFSYATQRSFSQDQLERFGLFSAGATAYALKSLSRSRWSSKTDYQRMIDDYAEVLQDYVNLKQPVALIQTLTAWRDS